MRLQQSKTLQQSIQKQKQSQSGVRLAKQTHSSFVDSLFLQAHISTLDQEYEIARQRNIQHAKQLLNKKRRKEYSPSSLDDTKNELPVSQELFNRTWIMDNKRPQDKNSPRLGKEEQPLSEDSIDISQNQNAWATQQTALQQLVNEQQAKVTEPEEICESTKRLTPENMVARLVDSTVKVEKQNVRAGKQPTLNVNVTVNTNDCAEIGQDIKRSTKDPDSPTLRKSVISVTKQQSISKVIAQKIEPCQRENTPPKMIDKLTTKTTKKGGVPMHTVQNRMTRGNYVLRDSLNNRNNNLSINKDLLQVSENQNVDQAIFNKQQLSARRQGNPDCVSSNDEGRTLTPNSQRFIFQAQFDHQKQLKQHGSSRVTPATLNEHIMSQEESQQILKDNTGQAIIAAPKLNYVKVTSIEVGTSTRRASLIETEMGTQRLVSNPTTKESDTFKNINMASEMQHKNKNDEASVLRQSQSGMGNMIAQPLIDLRFNQQKDSLIQNSMHEKQSKLVAPEVNKQQHKTSRLKLKIEEDFGNNADATQNTNRSHISNFDSQNEEKKKQVDIVLVNSTDCDIDFQANNLVEGLSDVERLEIRQTMKLVYPEMVLNQNARTNKKISRSPSRKKRNKKTYSRLCEKQAFKTQEEYNQKILFGQDISEERANLNDTRNYLLSQGQSQRYQGGIFTDTASYSKSLSKVPAPRSTLYSQEMAQRSMIAQQKLKHGFNGYVGQVSSKPTMNRGFMAAGSMTVRRTDKAQSKTNENYIARGGQSPQYTLRKFDLPPLTNQKFSDARMKSQKHECFSNLGSHNTSTYGEKEVGTDLHLLDQITANNEQIQQQGIQDETNQLNVLKQEQFHFKQIDEQRDKQKIDKEGAVIGMKKQIFKRDSGLSSNRKALEVISNQTVSKSPASRDKTPQSRDSPTKMLDQEAETNNAPNQVVQLGHQLGNQIEPLHGSQIYMQQRSRRGKTSYEGKRDTPVQTGGNNQQQELQQPENIRHHSNPSNMMIEKTFKLVSSGEVTLMNQTGNFQNYHQQQMRIQNNDRNRAFKVHHTRLNLDAINNSQQDQNTLYGSPRTVSPDTQHGGKFGKSPQVSESQLTNLSVDRQGFLWSPKMAQRGSRLAARKYISDHQAVKEPPSSQVVWKPNMTAIAEGKLKMELHPMELDNTQQQIRSPHNETMTNDAQTSKAVSLLENSTMLQDEDEFGSSMKLTVERQVGKRQTQLRPVVSGGLQVKNIRVSEQDKELLIDEPETVHLPHNRKDYGLQTSNQTKYLNLNTQVTSKDDFKASQPCNNEEIINRMHNQTLKLEQNSQLSIKQSIVANAAIDQNRNSSQKQSKLSTQQVPSSKQSSQLAQTGFQVKGQKLTINMGNTPALKTALNTTKNATTSNPNSDIPIETNLSQNIMRVQVQSTASKEYTIENTDLVKSEVSEKDKGASSPTITTSNQANQQQTTTQPNQEEEDSNMPQIKSLPHLLGIPDEDQQKAEPFKQKVKGTTSSKNFRMVSPKVKIQNTKKIEDNNFQQLQISPSANNTKHLLQDGGTNSTKDVVDKNKFKNLLAAECQELKNQVEIGFIQESRPNVRIINHEHIDQMNYRNMQQTRSIGTIGRSYADSQEQTEEDEKLTLQNKQVSTMIQTESDQKNEKGEIGSRKELAVWTDDIVGQNMTSQRASQDIQNKNDDTLHINTPPYRSRNKQKFTFASIERLKDFRSMESNKYSQQPYRENECKYVLTRTGETLQSNMRRAYGLRPLNEEKGEVTSNARRTYTNRITDGNHNLMFQRVPIQRLDGHMLSDVASPQESRYARRKLLNKQRHNHALSIQNETRQKNLEMSYNLSSPAARMRSLILINQKKLNAQTKPSLNVAPVLYEDIQAIKTWRTSNLR